MLSPAQDKFLKGLKAEPEDNWTEVFSSEHRTAQSLERKGLIELRRGAQWEARLVQAAPLVPPTDEIFEELMRALEKGLFGRAYALADEICRVERMGTSVDLLPKACSFKAMQAFKPEMLQGLEDRIQQYNMNCRMRPTRT